MFKKLRNRILAFNMIVTTLLVAAAFALVYVTSYLLTQSSYDARLAYTYTAGNGILFGMPAASDDGTVVTLFGDDTAITANGTLSLASGDAYGASITLPSDARPSFTALIRDDAEQMRFQALLLFQSQDEKFCWTATELAWEDFLASGIALDAYARETGSLTLNETDLRYSIAVLEAFPVFELVGTESELLLDYETMAALASRAAGAADTTTGVAGGEAEVAEVVEVAGEAEAAEVVETRKEAEAREKDDANREAEAIWSVEATGRPLVAEAIDADALLAAKTEAAAQTPVSGTWYQINFIDTTVEGLSSDSLMFMAVIVGAIIEVAIFLISFFFAQRAVRPIEAMYEQQRRLVADASHELKTPLATIMANFDVVTLDEEATIGSQREWLQAMRTGMDRMGHTIAGLLSLAQAEETPVKGIADKSVTATDVCAIVADELHLREGELAARGMTLAKMLGDEKAPVRADEGQLRQIISILIDNALTYGETNGQIECTLERRGRQVLLSVRNTGPGIPERDLPHVFERFYRADSARSSESGNAGLGLAIAHSLVEGMGGRIHAESEPDAWTTFTVTLPGV
ncbi:MAG: HAMP domain-containing histidine kinase [Coriobacteriales bacterium]|jgi:signal transduction histidine kinase|nr:HAMP domain-containing histidine kinase [Coriobacteriales bacterium]